jgi:hypothetical protein
LRLEAEIAGNVLQGISQDNSNGGRDPRLVQAGHNGQGGKSVNSGEPNTVWSRLAARRCRRGRKDFAEVRLKDASVCPVCEGVPPFSSFAEYTVQSEKVPRNEAIAEYSAVLAHSLQREAIRFQICRCKFCGHLFKNPTLAETEAKAIYSVEQMAVTEQYYQIYRHKALGAQNGKGVEASENGAIRRYEKSHARWLYEKAGRPSHADCWVLDFGGAEGSDLIPFSENGWNIVLCDYAAMKPKIEPCRVFRSVDQIDCQFDLVLSAHTFEHLIEPRRTLTEISSRMRSHASIVIEVPYEIPALLSGAMPCVWHIQFFSRSSIADLLARCGFEVRSVETVRGSYRGVEMYLLVATGELSGRERKLERGRFQRYPVWDVMTSGIRSDLCKRALHKCQRRLLSSTLGRFRKSAAGSR